MQQAFLYVSYLSEVEDLSRRLSNSKKIMEHIATNKTENAISAISPGGMGRFAKLVQELGTSTKTNDKLDSLVEYFTNAADKDKVWVIALFSGRRPRRTVSGTQLTEWCSELVKLPPWLFAECY